MSISKVKTETVPKRKYCSYKGSCVAEAGCIEKRGYKICTHYSKTIK